MGKPIPEETLARWEEEARKIQTGPYPNGIVQEAVKFAGVAAVAIPDLVAEVRKLRDLIRRMADELEERTLSQPLWPEIYAALGLDWEEHVRSTQGEGE